MLERLEDRRLLSGNDQIQLSGGYTLNSYAGVGFQENQVATMQVQVNGQADPTLSDFHAQINWGDSASWTSGDLVYQGTNGSWADYIIKGSHVYQKADSNIPIVIYVTGPDGTSASFDSNDIDYAEVLAMPSGIPGTQPSATANPTAPADVQIQLSGGYTLNSYAGVGFQENQVATMQVQVNGQADATLSDFHPQINWGDSAPGLRAISFIREPMGAGRTTSSRAATSTRKPTAIFPS